MIPAQTRYSDKFFRLFTRITRLWNSAIRRTRLQQPRGLLFLILALALILRVGYMPIIGHRWDIQLNYEWGWNVHHFGLFNLYLARADVDYPPIYMAVLGATVTAQALRGVGLNYQTDPLFTALLKLFPVLGDLLLITVVYYFLRDRKTLRWSIPVLLAISPVLISDSAWWGQSDSLMTVLVVLALVALTQDRPLFAWIFFAIGMLTKFQSVMLFPLLVVLTFRRYGWHSVAKGLVIGGAIGVFALTPFIAANGFSNALRPYIGTVDKYPKLTVNAFNFWYLVSLPDTNSLPWPDLAIADSIGILGPLTAKYAGLLMLATYTLLIGAAMWRRAREKQEFVWAAAFYFGFYMLPTQIHERYIYPAAILALIAYAQDRRIWPVALGVMFTAAYNIIQVSGPLHWLGLPPWPLSIAVHVALLNVVLMVELTRFALTTPPCEKPLTMGSGWKHALLTANRIVAALLVVGMVITLAATAPAVTAAEWLTKHLPERSSLAIEKEAGQTRKLVNDWAYAKRWDLDEVTTVETRPVSSWWASGVRYLIVDERTSPENFSQRLERLVEQGATVAYESQRLFGLGARQAILWAFHLDHPVNLTFDNSLRLIGYQILRNDYGEARLLLHWYTQRRTDTAYHRFVHAINSDTGDLIDQVDAPLSYNARPSSAWQQDSIIIETIGLPTGACLKPGKPCHIRFGLYQWPEGKRALITDQNQNVIGDHIDIPFPP